MNGVPSSSTPWCTIASSVYRVERRRVVVLGVDALPIELEARLL
jgi:hypothetical protein